MTHELPPLALLRLIRRNRRRYGGYVVHAGVALLLVGVAASSSFQHSRNVTLMPGQSTSVDGYKVAYVRPIAAATAQKLSFGAVLRVTKRGKPVSTLRTTRGFYPSQDPSLGPIGRFFNGEADSNVGLKAGLTRDIWTVVNPDLSPLQSRISKGDKLFLAAMMHTASGSTKLSAAQARTAMAQLWQLRDEAIIAIASRYVSHPWPINFLFIVDPLVSWIWIGALIVALGGLIALWPIPPAPARRRALAPAASRPVPAPVAVAREPARL
jgi:cytochrome c-type biogenesis protein CcmF